jgi:peptidoglycan/LPS O-acetylase OafA/YrhL
MDYDISNSSITTLVPNRQEYGKAPMAESASGNSSARIPELDGLRGVAILLVILCHYVGGAVHEPLGFWAHRLLSVSSVGWSGVDLFFVLSGFLIGGILLDARTTPHYFRAFYMRRVHRILPVYYSWLLIFAALVAIALWLAPGRYAVEKRDLTQLPYYLLFLQNMRYDQTFFQSVWMSVMWSLAVEEQFYLLAPPLIRFLSLRRIVVSLVATICLVPLLRLLALRYLTLGSYVAVLAMPCRADALAFGMLVAVGWRTVWFRAFLETNRLLMQRVLLGLTLGVAALLWWLAHPVSVVTALIGYTWLAAFFSCIMVVALSRTHGWIAGVLRWRMLRALGTISYCVYIIHLAFNRLAHLVVLHADPQIYNLRGVGVTLLALGLTLVVASLSWRYFEKPLIRRGHSYAYGGGPAE